MTTSPCRCDAFVHPHPLHIAAGLNTIPRQIALFPEWLRAMLHAVPAKPALSQWRPGGDDDLGVMLLEMWAYVADVLSFYDETIAHEEYLRTARRRPSVRKLTDLLGYVPRPAVGAEVDLGIIAEGRKPIALPAGTGFRSGAFDNEKPQVFETGSATSVHPLTSKWTLQPIRPDRLGVNSPESLLVTVDSANLSKGDLVLVRDTADATSLEVRDVTSVDQHLGADGATYSKVTFSSALTLSASVSPSDVALSKPAQKGGLWQGEIVFKPEPSGTGVFILLILFTGPVGPISTESGRGLILLDGLYRQIKAGDFVILSVDDDHRAFRVIENRERQIKVGGGETYEVNSNSVTSPNAYGPVTQLVLDATVDSRRPAAGSNWGNGLSLASRILVHYGFSSAGVVTVEAKTRIENGDPLTLTAPVEVPEDGTSPTQFLFEDLNENGVSAQGAVDLPNRNLTLDPGTDLGANGLAVPVDVFGNVVAATRGETVTDELLGVGDAASANQSFKLKKSPLTYLSAPTAGNDSGLKSTLRVRVDRVLWEEAASFFGQGPEDHVYIVRQDDDGNSLVTFGDGVRGSRLPTGAQVTATYRYGAGAAAPPAGSIKQMAKPVKGVTKVVNPVAAHGGADAEPRDGIREGGPRSALTLGRAVSLADMEAIAAVAPGVRAVKGEWTWNEARQRPVAYIWYIGDSGIEADVAERIRSVSDPATPIEVKPSTPIPFFLSIDVEVDRKYVVDDVLAEVRDALTNTDSGLLAPENIGIGAPLFQSRLFEVVLSVQGALAVHAAQFRREDPPSLRASRSYWRALSRHRVFIETILPTLHLVSPPTLTLGGSTGPIVISGPLLLRPLIPRLQPFLTFALSAPSGYHFDIEAGGLTLTGGNSGD